MTHYRNPAPPPPPARRDFRAELAALLSAFLFALMLLVAFGPIAGCKGVTPGQVNNVVVSGLSDVQEACVIAQALDPVPAIVQACQIDASLTPAVTAIVNEIAGLLAKQAAAKAAACPSAGVAPSVAAPASSGALLTGRKPL